MRKMKHKVLFSLPALLFGFLLLSISSTTYTAELPIKEKIAATEDGGSYVRMADNFFIIYDPSTTMDVPYKESGMTRLAMQKKIIRESNALLPELGWQAGLYPHWKGGLWLHGSPMAFKPYYRLQNYQRQQYAEAIEQLPVNPAGPPMLQIALMKLESLLGLPGRTEIFLFSDGKDSVFEGVEPEPLAQAKKLADKYDVCFTIVSSAEGEEEKQLLGDIAGVNSCSQVIDFDTVAEHPEHLLGKLYMDESAFNNVLFDFDKSNIKAEHTATLDKLNRFLAANPSAYTVLSGFTCNIGTEAYNISLSQRRAESVRNYLKNKFNIEEKRMLLYWYGFANPIADNNTEGGRELNRRVTITIRDNG